MEYLPGTYIPELSGLVLMWLAGSAYLFFSLHPAKRIIGWLGLVVFFTTGFGDYERRMEILHILTLPVIALSIGLAARELLRWRFRQTVMLATTAWLLAVLPACGSSGGGNGGGSEKEEATPNPDPESPDGPRHALYVQDASSLPPSNSRISFKNPDHRRCPLGSDPAVREGSICRAFFSQERHVLSSRKFFLEKRQPPRSVLYPTRGKYFENRRSKRR